MSDLTTHLSLNLLVKEFLKLVNIWRSYSKMVIADHVRHFAATALLCCGSCVQWVMGFFIWPMSTTF